jgi:hypothetical protein
MKATLVALVAGLTLGSTVLAKDSEGVLTYEMTMSSTDEQVQMGLDMMGTSEIKITFNKDFMKSEMQNMMMIQKTIVNKKEENGILLQEMNGMKMAIHMNQEQLKKQDPSNKDKSERTYEKTDEFKEIIGYKCRKVIVKSEEGTTVLWVTDEIEIGGKNQFYSEEAGGMALEMTTLMNQGGREITLNFVATSFKSKIKEKDAFSMEVPKGYKEMTYEEFEASMSRMRGRN